MRKRQIVHRPKNLKEAIEYKRLLKIATRTDRGAASPNVKGLFAAYSTPNATQMTNQASNLSYNAFNQQANYKPRGASGGMQISTVASYNSGYVAPNGPLQRKPLIYYTCGKHGHKSVLCRSNLPNATPSGNFVKGQWPLKRLDTTSNGKPNLPQSNMIVQSDEDESDSNNNG